MSENLCPICLEDVGNKDILICDKHSMHIECLNNCDKLECPLCKKHLFDRMSSVRPNPEVIEIFENEFDYSYLILAGIFLYYLFYGLIFFFYYFVPTKYQKTLFSILFVIFIFYLFNKYLESL